MAEYTPRTLPLFTDGFSSEDLERTARRTGFVQRASPMTGTRFLALVTFGRRFPQGENDQHFWVFQRSARVLEDHREIPQPGNRLARLVESGFPQDRVVAALVEVHADPFRLDVDHTPCCHACARQLCGRSGVKASQVLGQPAIATIGQHGQGGVEIDGESHGPRQTIDMQAMHAHPQAVLDAMASGVAYDQCPRTLLGVVGQEQGRGLPSPSRDRQLAQRALVPW
jgi:hypothetical protein